MKYAIVDGVKAEASKGAKGICQVCASEVIAKCGEIKVHHWAHKNVRKCDPWWENETEWHRNWKNQFPTDVQEVVHISETGEKHVADVKTEEGWVVEFQYSAISSEERHSRNEFYKKIIWIVDGTRRKNDLKQFDQILKSSLLLNKHLNIRQIQDPEKCRLLNEWGKTKSLVFFDFRLKGQSADILWFLYPCFKTDQFLVQPYHKNHLINLLRNGQFFERFAKPISSNRESFESGQLKQRAARLRTPIGAQRIRPMLSGRFGRRHSPRL